MNPVDMLRIVDSLHREKAIEKEIVFQAIESALVTAAKKHYGELEDITVTINRETGDLSGTLNGEVMDQAEISGRIGAQTAKQVIIQKIREAERDSLLGKFGAEIGTIINGVVTRNEGPATIVSFDGIEAILPRSEQIPGESHHPNERVRAVIFEVKPQGSRVKVVLSRTRPQLVQRLFEQEIPEIADGVITIQGIAREPGHRSKVAVSSSDARVDCVGACVGVRGNRIKNIVDELAGERIDIVRYNEDAETLIRAALQPAEVDQVLLCDMIGRAIVLVREDQLSLAIGRKGQNVRLASKLCGWDIEIMTNDELEQQIERAVAGFMQIDGMNEELAQRLVEQGYLSYDDLSVIEPDAFMEMGGMTEEQVNHIVEQAESLAEQAEKAADDERRRKKAEDAATAAAETAAAATAAAAPPAATEPTVPATPPADAPVSEEPGAVAPSTDTAG
ncbi:MAG TPA: transcription termination factor NusA [Pirellulaceae bacterium]|nr:MAG: transcription termination factor NusA [Verrucomicrobiota bacterium]HMC11808.1 transcription termination factor NusA [Pirellulaceae bacterium]